MSYKEKKQKLKEKLKKGKWNNPWDLSKDTKVCRFATDDMVDYPYSYDDSNHSTDYPKDQAPDPRRER